MFWNYRVVKTAGGYGVFEVYYDDDGKPISRTEDPILDFLLEEPEGIREELKTITAACDAPTLLDSEITMTGPLESHVAEILRLNWNPFQPDEDALFSEYVTHVVNLLRESADAKTIAEYLSQVEARRLGFVDTDPKELISVAHKLKKFVRGAT